MNVRNRVAVLTVVLFAVMVGEMSLSAQSNPGLTIVVLEGEGAVNNTEIGSGKSPIVEVRDENDKPVQGAKLTFSVPERGPSGTFFGAGSTLSITTNSQGRAIGAGFRPNTTQGRFQIRVTALHGGRTGSATITQINSQTGGSASASADKPRNFWRSKFFPIIVGGAIAGAIVAKKVGDDPPAASTVPATTISLGTITVGTPR